MDLRSSPIQGPLTGRQALVTGSSYGIGRGVALELARLGAGVIVTGRRQAEIDETVREIEALGGVAVGKPMDLMDNDAIDAFFTEFVEPLGGLDIFVNNAGVTKVAPILESEKSDIQRICQTNLLAAYYCLQHAARIMKDAGKGGSIVLVTSVNAYAPLPRQTFYSGTKAALEAICKAAAYEFSQYGIRVNTVAPGATLTGMTNLSSRKPEELCTDLPIPRIGYPEDMAKAVAYLVSDDASYVTGTAIVVDGGLRLRRG